MKEVSEFECRRHPEFPNRDVICHKHSNFKIQVIDLRTSTFRPMMAEVHYFGDNHGDELAFETIHYFKQSEAFILAAIDWYASYLEYTGMKVYTKRPF